MEAQILGSEALGKPVPAVANLIHLVSAKGVHVRDRDQLDTGRGDGVETGKFSAGSRQGQGKRLSAITKEIAACQNVVLIEIMVNLADQAGQVVVRRSDQRGIRDGVQRGGIDGTPKIIRLRGSGD